MKDLGARKNGKYDVDVEETWGKTHCPQVEEEL